MRQELQPEPEKRYSLKNKNQSLLSFMNNISKFTLNSILNTVLLVLLFTACTVSIKKEDKDVLKLEGTWELVSGTTIVQNDTTFTDYTKDQRMIKIINATHFAFVKHDLNKGKRFHRKL
jgi:hypothetical protein